MTARDIERWTPHPLGKSPDPAHFWAGLLHRVTDNGTRQFWSASDAHWRTCGEGCAYPASPLTTYALTWCEPESR